MGDGAKCEIGCEIAKYGTDDDFDRAMTMPIILMFCGIIRMYLIDKMN